MDFIKGVCHPRGQYDLMKEAGIEWVRTDCPYPFEKNGELRPRYISYKNECIEHASHGIKTFSVSPYPSTFIEYGIDPRTSEGLQKCGEVCEFLAHDLADVVDGWQITNEMYVVHFRAPLVHEEALPFIVECGKGLRRGNPNALIGHNSACDEWKPYYDMMNKEIGLDYVGLDHYAGSWLPGGPKDFHPEIEKLYEQTGLPVIIEEFGFPSMGGSIGEGEDIEFLNGLGFKDWDDAASRFDDFMTHTPKGFQERGREIAVPERKKFLYDNRTHLMKKWAESSDIVHTLEGQAQFYDELLPILMNEPHLMGAIIYCWSDSRACFLCGEEDCPIEIAWGLVDKDYNPKLSYYAVKRHFGK